MGGLWSAGYLDPFKKGTCRRVLEPKEPEREREGRIWGRKEGLQLGVGSRGVLNGHVGSRGAARGPHRCQA